MRGGSRIGGWAVAACVAASLALAAGPVQAATIGVTTNADEIAANANCSLREAITAANTDAAFDGCTGGSGADTINLPAAGSPYKETIPNGATPEDANAKGDFDVSGNVTIQGAGAASTIVDGAQLDRVFQILGSLTIVTIAGVTIQNGTAPFNGASLDGGGILNAGSLTLNNDVVTQNRMSAPPSAKGGDGGGVANSGTLVVNATSIDHNFASSTTSNFDGGAGGGISNAGAGTLTVNASTIASNKAGNPGFGTGRNGGGGGGIFSSSTGAVAVAGSTIADNAGGTGADAMFTGGSGGPGGGIDSSGTGSLTITGSAIVGNSGGRGGLNGPGGSGGGVETRGPLVLTNSTIASNTAGNSMGNVAGSGGGLDAFAPSAALTNDTFAGNGAGTGTGSGAINGQGGGIYVNVSAGGTAPTLTNTIIAASTVSGNCAGTAVTDHGHNVSFNSAGCPASFATGNPNLGLLQDNGGPTQTMSVAGPVAVDQVPVAGAGCPAADQRGIPRPQGPACDIGAFEVVNPITLSVSKPGTGSGTVTSSPDGIDCGASCSAQYAQHSSVTLTATPAAGSTFSGWSGACLGTGACTVALDANATVGASFTANPPPGVAPNTKISKAKVNQAKNSATFKFKSVGGSKAKAARGFQCALVKRKHKKPKFKACTSPKKYKHLKPHRYTFEVRAFDAAGKDATPAKKKFRIR